MRAISNVFIPLLAMVMFASSGGPAMAQDPVDDGTAVVLLETTLGEIEIVVDLERAPLSAGDFLKYVEKGLYEGAGFYRVVREDNDHGTPEIEVVQGGLLDEEKALPAIEHETTDQTGLRHRDGVISLARGKPGTGGGAAFFICIGDQPALDSGGMRNPDGLGFAAFGSVTRGMDVIRRIHGLPADAPTDEEYVMGQLLEEPILILSARKLRGPE